MSENFAYHDPAVEAKMASIRNLFHDSETSASGSCYRSSAE